MNEPTDRKPFQKKILARSPSHSLTAEDARDLLKTIRQGVDDVAQQVEAADKELSIILEAWAHEGHNAALQAAIEANDNSEAAEALVTELRERHQATIAARFDDPDHWWQHRHEARPSPVYEEPEER